MKSNALQWNTVTPLLKQVLTDVMQEALFDPFRLVGGTSLSLQYKAQLAHLNRGGYFEVTEANEIVRSFDKAQAAQKEAEEAEQKFKEIETKIEALLKKIDPPSVRFVREEGKPGNRTDQPYKFHLRGRSIVLEKL